MDHYSPIKVLSTFTILIILYTHKTTMFQVTIISLGFIFGCLGIKEPQKFPQDFKFGAVTAAFTVEGGWHADGEGDSLWHHLVHDFSDFIVTDLPWQKLIEQAEVAADSYHKWKEDIKIAKELGLSYYKFSIASSRIFPRGFNGSVNRAGIDYYNNLINGLLAEGIQPIATMYHHDGPVSDMIFYGGFPNSHVVEGMIKYANLLFSEMGDRVKNWDTFDDPYKTCKEVFGEFYGHTNEYFPSGEYEYRCGQNIILAHATIYRMYEKKYKPKQNGVIAMVFGLDWYEPLDAEKDKEAALRAMDFSIGWFLNPLINGDYPERMTKTIVDLSRKQNYPQSRLPSFSAEEKALIKGTVDVVALVYRSTYMVTDNFQVNNPPSALNDVQIKQSVKKEWEDSNSLFTTTPKGFRKALKYVWDNYGQPVMSTRVGYGAYHDSLNDTFRVEALQQFLEQASLSINEDKVNNSCFFVWSLVDSFFFQYAYTAKFGLYQVDFQDPARPRTPKQSAKYYKKVISTKNYEL